VHLVGFITKNFVTMHSHVKVKFEPTTRSFIRSPYCH